MTDELTEREEILLYVNAEQAEQIAALTAKVATLTRDLRRAQAAAAVAHDGDAE